MSRRGPQSNAVQIRLRPSWRAWTGFLGGFALGAMFLLATHDAWIEHASWEPGETALIDVCPLCDLNESISSGASFDEPGQVLINTLLWEAPPHGYAFMPSQRIATEPSSPRAPPAASQV